MLHNVMTAFAWAPPSWETITVYHVNPHQFGAIPVNMDTGDATGDLFFDLFEVIIAPLACEHGTTAGHSCTNPEAVGKDLMVNKLTLEVDGSYSDYAKCNIGVNGTDGRGHRCATGEYCCFCGDYRPEACEASVGREDLYDHFGPSNSSHHHSFCHILSPPSICYQSNAFKKLSPQKPGYWYSSLASGYCGAGSTGDNCTWRVKSVDKIVTRACHSRVFGMEVQAAGNPKCLDGCGDQRTNTSSPCWVDCFYKAALGPDSGKPGGAVEGMPVSELVAAWEKPFLPEAQGGCPAQKELASWYPPARGIDEAEK